MLNALHRSTLALAKRGLPVFPCKPREKIPMTKRGVLDATTDLAIVNSWWEGWPEQNIGLATGGNARLAVIDVDGDGGEATLSELERAHGKLPPTVEVITGNGRHLYFRGAAEFPTTGGKLGKGIDTRGEGGYVIAAPSVHPSGRRYQWSVDSAKQIAPLPEWIGQALSPHGDRARKGRSHKEWNALLAAAIPEGERNATLTSIAGKLLATKLSPILAADLLECVNVARCVPPLAQGEVEKIIVSVAKREMRKGTR
jgi:Bifunctional DNA primase/polymerase, N-terminal/Primase C terminal 1 (PriCT-1)